MRQAISWETAWEQCYEYFGVGDDEFDIEIGALRLAFFLASFGMFRASGKTRELQLKDFAHLVVIAREFVILRGRKPSFLSRNQVLVESFLRRLEEGITDLGVSATDTLTTKIALATTACVPAYDRFAKLALRKRGLVGTPSARGLLQLYQLRRKDLAQFGVTRDPQLPFMRDLDLGLMKTGIALHRSH